jgi:hypothetical protein
MENIKGYKVFNSDWTCRNKQYTCPGKFEEDVELDVCSRGLHFCKKAADCFNYYDFDSNNHVAEVIAYGKVKEDGDKCCTNKLEIVRELSWHEVLDIVNTGKDCTGNCNSGDCNSGNRNSGDWNSGDCNSGNCNSGNCNSGNWNSGDCNSGDCNSGNRNSGDWNSGDCNSGNRNSGNWNSGDWNKTNYSNGCFNTIEPKIKLFNKESDLTYNDWVLSDARDLLNKIPTEILEWVWFDDMSEEEKEVNPNAEYTDGYLKIMKPHECAQDWWNKLKDTDKKIILGIPNFDREIFKEITGIDVGEE